MRLSLFAFTLAAGLAATPAAAAVAIPAPACASDLTLSGASTILSCVGRFSGNLLNNAKVNQINSALTALGYDGPTVSYNLVPLSNITSLTSGKGASVDFPGLMNGTAYVGIHSGNGGKSGIGNQTSFYKINAVGLDTLFFNPSGGSTATLLALDAPNTPNLHSGAQRVRTVAVPEGLAAKFDGNLVTGSTYQLTFSARSGSGSSSGIGVSVHGSNIYNVDPVAGGYEDYSTTFKYYGDNTILFTGVGSGQNSLIDNVRVSLVAISSVPEPATWSMMIVGFGVSGAAMRRRRHKALVPA